MDQSPTIGLDLAKSVLQVHGVSADGTSVLRRQPRRGQVPAVFAPLESCLIGMEACSGAHHRARELAALGHEPRLMPFVATIDPLDRSLHARTLREVLCEAGQDRPRRFRGDPR